MVLFATVSNAYPSKMSCAFRIYIYLQGHSSYSFSGSLPVLI
jgi:hypothetical protein